MRRADITAQYKQRYLSAINNDDPRAEALGDLAVKDAAQVKGGTPNGKQLILSIKDGPAVD
jgi:hypothetical protein